MIPNELKIFFERRPWDYRFVDVLIRTKDAIAECQFKTLSQDDLNYIPEPTFRIGNEAAQEIMDNLWRLGFRPSEGIGSAGSLEATQKHLDDMRRLVFKGKTT